MSVVAKFTVASRSEAAGGYFSVVLLPVTSGSKENEEFYKWTPGGRIELSTINASAAEAFKPGTEKYVTFSDGNPAGHRCHPRDSIDC